MAETESFEKKPLSPISIIAAMTASVASMLLGSLFSDKGTIYGAAIGAAASSTVAVIAENNGRKAHAKLKALREQEKADAEPGHHLQEQLKELPLGREALIRARQKRIMRKGRRSLLKLAGFTAGLVLICCLAAFFTIFAIEAATGKTVHSNFGGPAQYGTSFNYSTKSPAPVTPAPSSYEGSGGAVPSESPSGSPSPSSSPSPSGTSLSPSPSATVTVSPTGPPGGSPGA